MAEMIVQAGRRFNINPQVLLVTLRKESRLFNLVNPTIDHYHFAMGYGCPDTGPGFSARCDPRWKGFWRQMEGAAWQFNEYRVNNHRFNFSPGRTHNIQFHPNPACGTQSVFIENMATAALYIYTPYVPNQAALNAWPGGAPPCGAYGNRNFFMMFNQMFGSTWGTTWERMVDPRVMTMSRSGFKTIPGTGLDDGIQWLTEGQVIMFTHRTTLADGDVCLRTEWDVIHNVNLCVRLSRLREYNLQFEMLEGNDRFMRVNARTNKIDMLRLGINRYLFHNQVMQAGQLIEFAARATIRGTTVYVTRWDWDHDLRRQAVLAERLTPTSIYEDIEPVYMRLTSSRQKVHPATGELVGATVEADRVMRFPSKTVINGRTYYRTGWDTANDYDLTFPADALSDELFIPMVSPRYMSIRGSATTKLRMPSLEADPTDHLYNGQVVFFSTRINLNGTVLLRTRHDTERNIQKAIRLNQTSDL